MKFKLTAVTVAALAVALFADALDGAVIGAVPYVGDVFDALIIVVLFVLLRDFRVLLALPEFASLFPPLAPIEILPFYTGMVVYVIYKQAHEGKLARK